MTLKQADISEWRKNFVSPAKRSNEWIFSKRWVDQLCGRLVVLFLTNLALLALGYSFTRFVLGGGNDVVAIAYYAAWPIWLLIAVFLRPVMRCWFWLARRHQRFFQLHRWMTSDTDIFEPAPPDTVPGVCVDNQRFFSFLESSQREPSVKANSGFALLAVRKLTTHQRGWQLIAVGVALAGLLVGLQVLLWPVMISIIFPDRTPEWIVPFLFVVFLSLLTVPVGTLLYFVSEARLKLNPTAEDSLQNDPRCPIILLRSFADDDLEIAETDASREPNSVEEYKRILDEMDAAAAIIPASVRPPFEKLESVVARVLSKFGPFVAVGQPGRRAIFPAARAYLRDSEWRDAVRSWIDEAELIVVIASWTSVREFMAAAVACGVKYSPLENFPHDLAIGVAHYGRIVRGGWRRVLKDGPAEPVRG